VRVGGISAEHKKEAAEMRIHTNATTEQIRAAINSVPTVYTERLTEHRSNTHARAFEINLSGSGRHGGQYGNRDAKSATWDEWGVVMAAIFAADLTTRMGGTQERPIYANAEDFHWQTGERFALRRMPNDTHAQHKWEFVQVGEFKCKGSKGQPCTAIKRWKLRRFEPDPHREISIKAGHDGSFYTLADKRRIAES
jgi:hypothetical protein